MRRRSFLRLRAVTIQDAPLQKNHHARFTQIKRAHRDTKKISAVTTAVLSLSPSCRNGFHNLMVSLYLPGCRPCPGIFSRSTCCTSVLTCHACPVQLRVCPRPNAVFTSCSRCFAIKVWNARGHILSAWPRFVFRCRARGRKTQVQSCRCRCGPILVYRDSRPDFVPGPATGQMQCNFQTPVLM